MKKLWNPNKGDSFITSIVPVLIPGFDASIFTYGVNIRGSWVRYISTVLLFLQLFYKSKVSLKWREKNWLFSSLGHIFWFINLSLFFFFTFSEYFPTNLSFTVPCFNYELNTYNI